MPMNYDRMKERGKYQDWLDYTKKYQKEKYFAVSLKFNKQEDPDVCEFLKPYAAKKQMNKLVKQIVKEYVAAHKNSK